MQKIRKKENDFNHLKIKLLIRFSAIVLISFMLIWLIYEFVFRGRLAEGLVILFQRIFKMDYVNALNLYQQMIRNWRDIYVAFALGGSFLILIHIVLNWFTHYLHLIDQGIASLLDDKEAVILPPELAATERRLMEVRNELEHRLLSAKIAEQRKNDLVMYLAHDIRTPLTSVIGYLSLLEETSDLPAEQREKYIGITLDKACHLDRMVNEFFEITRYHSQEIRINKVKVDVYYMLVQISDELLPFLEKNKNRVVLDADEKLEVEVDPEKLARAFNNILKNAATYSYPDTEIKIEAKMINDVVVIAFENQGNTIPENQLTSVFDKFYRADSSRGTATGGAGLGLAIAKEIIALHGGTISVQSRKEKTCFTVSLPVQN